MSDRIIKPLGKRRSLTSELIEQLRGQILNGTLTSGQQLPTEQELVRSADVSRTVVREAVAALKADGLVITRQGVGAFVAPNAGAAPFRISSEEMETLEEVINVLELRMAVEIEMAGTAARRREPEDIVAMQECLNRIDAYLDTGDDATEPDFELHTAIAKATKNPQFRRFIDFLGKHMIPPHDLVPKFAAGRTEEEVREHQAELLRQTQVEHREIVEAIADGNERLAREVTRRHLANSIERHRRLLKQN